MTQKYRKYLRRARELGSRHAKVIFVKSIRVAEWVRMKCQFGCDGYGQCLTCPPHAPTPEQTRRVLKCYRRAILLHGDGHADIRAIVGTLEREVFLDGYHKAFGLGAGPCELCAKCSEFCCHPEKARPSLEACGIDVFATVRANGFPIKVVRAPGCSENYYGILLVE